LPAPVQIAPANGATGVALSPTLSWTAVAGAINYDLYFGTTNPPPFFGNVGNSSTPSGLLPGVKYYWRVAAVNSGNVEGISSPVWSFTTARSATPGIFRGNGLWAIDRNRNWQWDAGTIDSYFFLGQTGDIPVAGDFNGDGVVEIGIFRNGLWA